MNPGSKVRRRWVVRAGDGPLLRDVLARADVDAGAVRDGRVFVGRHRVVRDDEAVLEGDVVEVAGPQDGPGEARILADGGDVVAVEKPAGIPTIADHAGAAHALVTLAARALGVEASHLHPTSRLDRDVSGGRSARTPRLRAVGGRDAVPAATDYAVCGRAGRGAVLLAVSPRTGRTHQIRVHASHAGSPLVGDHAYGGRVRLVLPNGRVHEPGRIALHALRISVPQATGEPLVVLAPIPDALRDLWSALGGAPDAWELAGSWDFASP